MSTLTEEKYTDTQRLEWLERMAKEKGGILLHAERQATGRLGLGLWPDRTLREAIDGCLDTEQT